MRCCGIERGVRLHCFQLAGCLQKMIRLFIADLLAKDLPVLLLAGQVGI